MLGFSSPLAPPVSQQQPSVAQPPAQPAQQPGPMASTMLGFAAPVELRQALQQAQPPAAQPQPQAPAPAAKPVIAKTMLGVAMPGIAPVHAPAEPPRGIGSGTILGVAVPGIAPIHPPPGTPAPSVAYEPPPPVVPIVPAPAPLAREAAPAAPVRSSRSGMPLAIVAAVVGVLLLGGGVVLLLVARSAPPISATAKASPDGKEQLHLVCESCPDGTTVASQGVKATFKTKAADLDLAAPLAIGDNTFQLAIDRPGVGRDETVKLVLPLAYRIRGDVDGVNADPPALRVQVEAQKGSAVSVDGKPVTLDASGKATLTYDITADTSGAADETKTVERKIPYEVVDADKKKTTGEVVIRVGVVPLHVDAPGIALVTDQGSVWVSGATAKGAEVTANGTPATLSPDGSFEGKVDLAPDAKAITLRAAAAKDAAVKVAPRTVTIPVAHVPALLDAANAFDKGGTFPVLTPGPITSITGTVIDVRATHHHTALLVDSKKDCPSEPCLVKVDFGGDTSLRAGDSVEAFGVSGLPVATNKGQNLPHIDAALVVPRKASGKR